MIRRLHLTGIQVAVFCVLLFALPGVVSAANLQYGSTGLIGQDNFGITYDSPEGETNFVCNLTSQECNRQQVGFSPRPPTSDVEGNLYWSPQNTYAVLERPLQVFDKYLYRVYRNEGDTLVPVGYVPYYEQTTQLRFSQDENSLFLADSGGYVASVPVNAPFKAATSTINTQALGRWVLSPDGSLIAGYKRSDSDGQAPYRLVVQRLADGDGVADMPSNTQHDIAISEDNKTIAYINTADGGRTLTVRSLTSASSSSEDIDQGSWINHLVTANGNFYYTANNERDPYQYNLYEYDPASGGVNRIEGGIAETANLRATPRQVLFAERQGAVRHVGRYDTSKKSTIIYDLLASEGDDSGRAVRRQVVQVGDNLTGSLLTPHIREPQNVLVWLHGGPHRQSHPGYNSSLIYGVYDELLNAFARSGWAVLKLDYTGSVGYSADFRDEIINNIGEKDVADTEAAVSWLKNEFDNPSINLMGVSYGGYLGLKTAVENSDKINRVVSVNGVTDWMTDTLIDPTFRPYFGGRASPETIDSYMQSSLIYDLENLKETPIAIIQSTEDDIVDPVQAALLDRVANKEDVPVTYKQLEGAPHTIKKRSHLNTLCSTTSNFLSIDGVCRLR